MPQPSARHLHVGLPHRANPTPGCPPLLQIYSVESHRLALALDRRGALVQIVRSAVLQVRCTRCAVSWHAMLLAVYHNDTSWMWRVCSCPAVALLPAACTCSDKGNTKPLLSNCLATVLLPSRPWG